MSKGSAKQAPASPQDAPADDKSPRSLKLAENGIKTGHDFANVMSAMMSDLIDGRITPSIGNAVCNAGGKLLKVVEMQHKYGTQLGDGGKKTIVLAIEEARDNVVVVGDGGQSK